jgi:hypothetical protein
MLLRSSLLEVELPELPVPRRYRHLPSGRTVEGADPHAGALRLNGKAAPWAEWTVSSAGGGSVAEYRAAHGPTGIGLTIRFEVDGTALRFGIADVRDGTTPLRSLAWEALPLLRCTGLDWSIFRDRFTTVPWDAPMARGLWWKDYETRKVGAAFPDGGAQQNVHACAFDGKLCCFVRTTYPILPLTTRLVESSRYPLRCDTAEIGLGEWRYRVRSVTAPLLQGEVVFLQDTNGDGKADECDYQLAVNRGLPAPDAQYGSAIWYKIFCGMEGKVETSYAQCLEIIRRVHEWSGGLPQIAYLVGWQYDGHDSGYPAMDRLNQRLGSREELLELFRVAREQYDCTVSVHANLDDSYREHPQWDESVIGRDVDGSLMRWEMFNGKQSYHISHTKDVESGSVFRRLDEMLALLPLQSTIHIDAFRTTNASWEEDGFLGEAEELYCGMLPILAYLKGRGLDISTEGLNGMRIEPAGIFSAFWHIGGVPPLLYHRKLLGGGRRADALSYALGTAINLDFTAALLRDKPEAMVDYLALGAMLYHFYQSREMLECRIDESGCRFSYGDGTLGVG